MTHLWTLSEAPISLEIVVVALILLLSFAGGFAYGCRRTALLSRSVAAFDTLLSLVLLAAAFLLGSLMTYVFFSFASW